MKNKKKKKTKERKRSRSDIAPFVIQVTLLIRSRYLVNMSWHKLSQLLVEGILIKKSIFLSFSLLSLLRSEA